MTSDNEAFGLVLQQLEALEEDPTSAQMVRAALERLHEVEMTITFDTVLAYLGHYQELSGASMFAALIVREDRRQRLQQTLAALPVGTCH